jgi:hypothetical protein
LLREIAKRYLSGVDILKSAAKYEIGKMNGINIFSGRDLGK